MTTLRDTNTSTKTTGKLNKYIDWEIEVEHLWELKTTTAAVAMRALGTIKDMENYTNKIPGNIHELQKMTLLSKAHLLRRVLSINWKLSLPPKVHGLDSDVERENHPQLH